MVMSLLKPFRLRKGDTLGVIATSTPVSRAGDETIERSYAFLRSKGFNVVEAPNCRKVYGHAAGTVQERVDALHAFFKDSSIKGIIAFWGGFQTHQLLEYLDYELIKKNPKPIIGYSDMTALQLGIFAKTGLVTFSGPCGITFGKPRIFEYSWKHFEKTLMTPEIPFMLEQSTEYSDNEWWLRADKRVLVKKTSGWKTYQGGSAEGTLIGGNLGTMLLLHGTEYWPDLKNAILFVEEDEEEKPQTIDRLFTKLRQIGVFDQIKGLVVGRFHSKVGFTSKDSFELILKDALKGYDFPVLYDVDFGHTDPLVTLPIGIKCYMDADKKEIIYLEAGIK